MRIYVPPPGGDFSFSVADMAALVERVSTEKYGGNVRILSSRQISRTNLRITLTVRNPNGRGARVTPGGFHLQAACWHVYRDVLAALYDAYPDARVNTGTARYISREHFLASGDATGQLPVGLPGQQIPAVKACDCERATEGESA